MEQNILTFPGVLDTQKVSDTPAIAKPNTSAQVHTLLTKSSFQIHTERFGNKRGLFEPFFNILLSTKNVAIIWEEKDIFDGILRVESKQAWTYEITIGDFLAMTEIVKGMTAKNDVMQYLIGNFSSREIDVGYTNKKEEKFTEIFMDEEKLLAFHAEEERLVWKIWSPQEDVFHGLTLDNLELDYSPDDFLHLDNAYLLHLFSLARREYICKGIDLKWGLTMELSKYEDGRTTTTHIPLVYIDRIIDAAILRLASKDKSKNGLRTIQNPLVYINCSSLHKRMDKFYTDEVFPLLNLEVAEWDE